MRIVSLLVCLGAVASSTGCYRYVTRLPGVVDLRTDGSEAERATGVRVDPETRRDGVMALALGDGATLRAGRIVVEERHYWFLGAVPLLNTSARDEVGAAVGASGALRNVSIGEELGLIDALLTIGGRIVPLTQYVLPSYTFRFTGDPVVAPDAPRAPGPGVDDGGPFQDDGEDDGLRQEGAPPAPPASFDDGAPTPIGPPGPGAPPPTDEPPPLLEALPAPSAPPAPEAP